jgi:hypothetical protein
MLMMMQKPSTGAFGMTDKEMREAEKFIQATCEETCHTIEAQMTEKFGAGCELDFDGTVVLGSTIRMKVKVSKASDDLFAAVNAHCMDLEENVAYPEIRFKIQRQLEPVPAAA